MLNKERLSSHENISLPCLIKLLFNEHSSLFFDKLWNLGHLSKTSPEWLVTPAWKWANPHFDYLSKSSHMYKFIDIRKQENSFLSLMRTRAHVRSNNQLTLAGCHSPRHSLLCRIFAKPTQKFVKWSTIKEEWIINRLFKDYRLANANSRSDTESSHQIPPPTSHNSLLEFDFLLLFFCLFAYLSLESKLSL